MFDYTFSASYNNGDKISIEILNCPDYREAEKKAKEKASDELGVISERVIVGLVKEIPSF